MRALISVSVLMLGCTGGTSTDTGPQAEYSSVNPYNIDRPATDPGYIWEDRLESGAPIDLGFAEEIYCFPATENENFNGSHVLTDFTQYARTDVTILVTPESGVDLSLYVIQTGIGNESWPPNISGGGGTICEVSYDQVSDNNPGSPEGLTIPGWENDYRLIIGVAGAQGERSGAFKVEFWEAPS